MSFIAAEIDGMDPIEAGAIRAIKQAELECREAAKKLLWAQSRLESARTMAKELLAPKSKTDQFVENTELHTGIINGAEEHSEQNVDNSAWAEALTVDTHEDEWREGVYAVEAVFEAEEKKRAELEAFNRAAEFLRQQLSEEAIQASINDRHIEYLDCGGQYQVAQWLINEVEGFVEKGSSRLAVTINLDLALQGCDPQTSQFLQALPYGKVLGIKASVEPTSSVLVDYCDGSSWEANSSERSEESTLLWDSLAWDSISDSAIDVPFMDCGFDDVEPVVHGGPMPLPPPISSSSLLVPVASPKGWLSALKSSAQNPLIKHKEVMLCAAAFVYSVANMLHMCELTVLLADACIIATVGVVSALVACAVGVVRPPLPPVVKELISKSWLKDYSYSSHSYVVSSGRPWDQVVFWMVAASAVLSSATVTAILMKSVQVAVPALVQGVYELIPLQLFGLLSSVALPRIVFVGLGLVGAHTVMNESVPYLVSGTAWMLLLLSTLVAVASVPLILAGCTSRMTPRNSSKSVESLKGEL